MPGNGPPRLYLDANVLLAFVGDEEGRAGTVQALLHQARNGEIEVVTSALSITEVAFGAHERDQGLTEEGEGHIDQLWTPASPIRLIDMTETVARQARAVIRRAHAAGGGIRSADAVHIASAMLFGCSSVFTYEDEAKRARWSEVSGLEVEEPYTDTPQLDV